MIREIGLPTANLLTAPLALTPILKGLARVNIIPCPVRKHTWPAKLAPPRLVVISGISHDQREIGAELRGGAVLCAAYLALDFGNVHLAGFIHKR
jgi:hypothetical protein